MMCHACFSDMSSPGDDLSKRACVAAVEMGVPDACIGCGAPVSENEGAKVLKALKAARKEFGSKPESEEVSVE